MGEGYGHAFRIFVGLFGALGVGFGFLLELPVGDPLPVWNDGFVEPGDTAAGLAPALPVITINDLAPCGANPREVCSLAVLYSLYLLFLLHPYHIQAQYIGRSGAFQGNMCCVQS